MKIKCLFQPSTYPFLPNHLNNELLYHSEFHEYYVFNILIVSEEMIELKHYVLHNELIFLMKYFIFCKWKNHSIDNNVL